VRIAFSYLDVHLLVISHSILFNNLVELCMYGYIKIRNGVVLMQFQEIMQIQYRISRILISCNFFKAKFFKILIQQLTSLLVYPVNHLEHMLYIHPIDLRLYYFRLWFQHPHSTVVTTCVIPLIVIAAITVKLPIVKCRSSSKWFKFL